MSSTSLRDYLVLAVRLVLASLLLFSAFAKLRSPQSFVIFLAKLRI